ncbi:hypothetical protein EV363DRAFT_1176269, partial [Boletus edulis]
STLTLMVALSCPVPPDRDAGRNLSLSDTLCVTLFYYEDATIDPTPVFVNEDSWKELTPRVHAPR